MIALLLVKNFGCLLFLFFLCRLQKWLQVHRELKSCPFVRIANVTNFTTKIQADVATNVQSKSLTLRIDFAGAFKLAKGLKKSFIVFTLNSRSVVSYFYF